MRERTWIAAALSVAVGCGGSAERILDGGPDDAAARPVDLARPIDGAPIADLALPDLAVADLARPDLALPDLALARDLATLDLARPSDLTARPPDLTATPPDLTARPPDLTAKPPDLTAKPPDLTAKPPDLAMRPDGAACATFGFAPATSYAVGAAPFAIAAGDLDGDGFPDLVAGNAGDRSISVLLNAGAGGGGRFGVAVPYPLAGSPTGAKATSVAIADFNGDGHLDLATADFVANQATGATVFLGKGDGTFPTTSFVSVGFGTHDVVALDANGDGRPDLACTWFSGALNDVAILLGNGDGTFQSPTQYGVGRGPQGLATGDLNHDGHADLVTANSGGGTVSVLLGNGDGTFATAVAYAAGAGPSGVALRDLDLDGNPDVAVALNGAGTVGVLAGAGDGTLRGVVTYAAPMFSIAVADFNCDGRPDVAGGLPTSPGVVNVALGDAALGLLAPVSLACGNHTLGVAVGDYDRDGLNDLAAVNQNDNTISVLLNASK